MAQEVIKPDDHDPKHLSSEWNGSLVEENARLQKENARLYELIDKLKQIITDLEHNATEYNSTIDSLRQQVTELEYKANHDHLTGALNLRGLEKRLDAEPNPSAILVIDATNLKAVNDNYGYSHGDEVIKATHDILRESTRQHDVIARVGGDEFIVLLYGDKNEVDDTATKDVHRRHGPASSKRELVQIVNDRIGYNLDHFTGENQQLIALNFNLAVGGVACDVGVPMEENIKVATFFMKEAKAKQHQKGKYR